MKLHRNGKPWLCTAREAGRYGTEHPFLITLRDGTRALAATDGRRAVVLPVDGEEGDTDGAVTREAITAAGKARPKSCGDDVYVRANGSLEIPGGATFPRPEQGSDGQPFGRFPPVEDVTPRGEPEYRITFDAKFLAEIAAAMGCDAVTLELHDDGLPIVVLPSTGGVRDCSPVPGARGLLMPISAPGSGIVKRQANPKRAAAAAARETAAAAQEGGAP